jgi:hypothetical protein
MRALTLAVTLVFVLSAVPIFGSGPAKAQEPDYGGLVKSALSQLKGDFKDFGNKHLDPKFMTWIDNWDGSSLPETGDIEVETAKGTFEIKNGEVGNKKVYSSKNPDNVLIAVTAMDGKGRTHGTTFEPIDQSDTIVVRLDRVDVGSLVGMKAVLYHELVHVAQHRNENFTEDLRGNWEVEAHASMLPVLIDLYKLHPDSEKELLGLLDKVIKGLRKWLPRCKDKIRAMKALVDTKSDIKKEIGAEVAQLEVKIDALKLEIKLDKLLVELKKLLENNRKLLNDLENLIELMETFKEHQDNIKELRKEKLPAKNKKAINENKSASRRVKKEIEALTGNIKSQINQEIKDINAIIKLKDGKNGIQKEIAGLLKKLNDLLPKLGDPKFAELHRELDWVRAQLLDISIDLKIIDFKLLVLKKLEKTIHDYV